MKMKRFGRKILSILLTFAVVIALPDVSFTVYANDLPEWAGSAGLTDESASWNAASGTLTLLQNVTVTDTIAVSGTVTLNLNGCNITMTGDSSVITVNSGTALSLKNTGSGGGVISGGKGQTESGDGSRRGGGLYIRGGSVTMYDGVTISGNDGGSYGGGVHVRESGSFTMEGGTITNNTVSGGWNGGAGVHLDDGGTFTMKGGLVTGNFDDANGDSVGVMANANTTLDLQGGTISGNTNNQSNKTTYAVMSGGVAKLSGDISISGASTGSAQVVDLYLTDNKKVTITGALTGSEPIKVKVNDDARVFTDSENTNYNDAEKFSSVDTNYEVLKNETSGQLYLGTPPVASVTKDGTVQYGTFSDAVTAWNSAGSGAELKLLSDVTTSSTISVSGTKILELNGHGIKMTGSGSVISIGYGASLTLNDGGSTVHYYTVQNHLAIVGDSAGQGSSFTGGYITGGTSDQGGGIYIDGGTFILNGGSIIGNHGTDHAGGIWARGSTCNVTINGGAILYNICSYQGGAMDFGDGTLTVNGGTIHDNYSEGDGYSHAGGIHYCGGNGFLFSGNPVIKDNRQSNNGNERSIDVSMDDGNYISVDGEMTTGASVGVFMNNPGVFTDSEHTGVNNAERFFSDVDGHEVLKNTDGQLYLGTPPVASVTNGGTVKDYETFTAALAEWKDDNTLKLLQNVETGSEIQVPAGNVTLDLNGYALKKTGSAGSVFYIGNGSHLILTDSNGADSTHYYSAATNVAPGTVSDTRDAGHPYSFTGGYITGGKGRTNPGNTDWRKGGAVYINGGGLTMNGGTFIGNTVDSSGMNGVEGGTVYVNQGIFVLNGGSILAGYSSNGAGGVFAESAAAFQMTGGEIRHCFGRYGGALRGGTCVLSGGTITENAMNEGNGIVEAGSLSISGNPVISGNTLSGNARNIFLANEKKISITGELAEGADLGITMQTAGVFTDSTSTDYNDAGRFTSDNTEYEIVKGSDGQLKLLIHAHEWSYKAEGAAITASCIGEGTCEYGSEGFSVMINAPEDLVYDGNAKPAGISGYPEVAVDGLAEAPTVITYYLSAGEGSTSADGEPLEGAPVKAGNYVAQMIWGRETASLAFSIEKAAAGIATLPQAKSLLYKGGPQELVAAGEAANGIMKYALGTNGEKAPADSAFKTEVVCGTNAGDYYVWYKAAGDANHKDTEASCITVTIYRKSIQVKGIKAKDKTYDGTTEAVLDFSGVDLEECGMLKGDSLSVKAKGVFEDGNAGEKKKVLISDFVLSGSSAANYIVTEGGQQTEAEAGITKRAAFVKAKDQMTVLNGSIEESADQAVLEGAVSGHELTAVKLTASSRAKVTVSGTITPSDAVIMDENTDVTENYSIFYTAGVLTVKKGEASPGTVPEPKTGLMEDGSEQELATAGKSEDGIYYYRLGKTGTWGTEVPKASKAGTYVVFYFLKGDADHTDIGSQDVPQGSFSVIIASKEIAGVTGKVLEADGETPAGGAEVLLKQGDRKVESVRTTEDGVYQLTAGAGKYNLVVVWEPEDGRGVVTKTMMLNLEGSMEVDIILPEGQVNSILKVGEDSPEILVDGLDAEAEAIQKETGGGFVEVMMKVDEKTATDAAKDDGAAAIGEKAPEKKLDFYEILVEKTVDSQTTRMENTKNVMEIIIPYLHTGRQEVCAYRYHGSEVQVLKEDSTKEDGTFSVDREAGVICIYASRFSVYAIGYTPYHKVSSTLTLGDYTGDAAVTLEKADSGEKVKSMTISVKKGKGTCEVSDVPKGAYILTAEWEDGKTGQITLPFEIN